MFVPYPEFDIRAAAKGGMIWCDDLSTADKIASYETVMVGIVHQVAIIDPDKTPENLVEIAPGVFCKDQEGKKRAQSRVRYALGLD